MDGPARRPSVAGRLTVFFLVLLTALSVGAAAGRWAGPVDDATGGYSSSADPHAGH